MDESVQKHIEESLPKVGRFRDVADAILRGCVLTLPTTGHACDRARDGRITHACAWAAYYVGIRGVYGKLGDCDRYCELIPEYIGRYGEHVPASFTRGVTREQIAARIAAL